MCSSLRRRRSCTGSASPSIGIGDDGTIAATRASADSHLLGGVDSRSSSVSDSNAAAVGGLITRSSKAMPSAAASRGAITLPPEPYVADTVTTRAVGFGASVTAILQLGGSPQCCRSPWAVCPTSPSGRSDQQVTSAGGTMPLAACAGAVASDPSAAIDVSGAQRRGRLGGRGRRRRGAQPVGRRGGGRRVGRRSAQRRLAAEHVEDLLHLRRVDLRFEHVVVLHDLTAWPPPGRSGTPSAWTCWSTPRNWSMSSIDSD